MKTITWNFPLPRTHTGALLGNGTQGLMVWGVDALHITVGRAGFWDHRAGNLFASRTTYADVRRLLESGDEAGLRRLFARPDARPGEPPFPTQVGGGRLELHMPGWKPRTATLELERAVLRITLVNDAGDSAVVLVRQAINAELAWIELDEALAAAELRLRPSWEWVGEQLAGWGVAPPETWGDNRQGGFVQTLPDDDPLALAWARQAGTITLATALGERARDRAVALAGAADLAATAARADTWWQQYWAGVPTAVLPDPVAQHAWDYGLYKLAGLTHPGGVAATLQGPWLEEYQLPPWSCDYHFNINVQMIYWPCLMAGRFEHLWPMWRLLQSWLPRLHANGAHFFQAEGALLMPHAVDDRCAAVGTFWTGMIDQACAAWMAQLAWLHYRHSGDEQVLHAIAWPLMVGAFNGYWAMLEEVQHNGRTVLSLPVSVSPEYGGDGFHAWGRDASFQLAALHMLAAMLPRAADVLGQAHDPRWARVAAELPPYTLAGPPEKPRIGLWQGQDLDESHRHHAHLAAIYPFDTFDPRDEAHAAIVAATLEHWVYRGAGLWSGWCVPWAAQLCARCDLPDAAVTWLHWWKLVFTNEGHGTLHNGAFPGATLIWGWPRNPDGELHEIMQADAGMGALSAVQELLVQQRGPILAVLPAIPRDWRSCSFDGVWVEGGFRIGASVEEGAVVEVRVEATRAGHLRLAHNLGQHWTLDNQQHSGAVVEADLQAGQRLVLRRERVATGA